MSDFLKKNIQYLIRRRQRHEKALEKIEILVRRPDLSRVTVHCHFLLWEKIHKSRWVVEQMLDDCIKKERKNAGVSEKMEK